jgi:hypothetical protein
MRRDARLNIHGSREPAVQDIHGLALQMSTLDQTSFAQ